jgi:hypothetical protein
MKNSASKGKRPPSNTKNNKDLSLSLNKNQINIKKK